MFTHHSLSNYIPTSLLFSFSIYTLFSLILQPVNTVTCNPAHNRIDVGGVCVCMPGYYDSGPTNCPSCNALCLTCVTTSTTCTSCDSALHLTISGSTCICMDGYVMITGVCQPCHYSCTTCSGLLSTNCITCDTSIRLYVTATTSCICLNGTYDDTTLQSCQPCHIKCLWCTSSTENDCTNCNAMLLRSIGTANPGPCLCFSGYYDTTAALCSQCDPTCLTCVTTSTTCATCDGALFRSLSGTSCLCQSHYYHSGSPTCSMCSGRCGNCVTTASTCLTCNTTLRVLTGTDCPCISGYHQITATLTCSPCTSYCLTCQNSSSTCLSCYSYGNRELYNATCRCLTGYYDNGTINCQPCPYQCVACVGPSPPVCNVCDASLYRTLTSGGCPCDNGYYDNGSLACQPCSYSCQTCSLSPTSCLSCSPTSHRTLTSTDCLCQIGYYQDNISSICPSCHYSCISCFDSSNVSCYTCQINRNYANYSCPCVDGMYEIGQLCYNCDTACATCIDSSTTCTSCTFSRVLNGSTCVCAIGFYVSGLTCAPCDINCLTCLGSATYCTSCNSTHLTILSSSSCICPSTYYLPTSTPICQPCSPTCQTCLSSPSYCLSCSSSLYRTLSGNTCLCNIGYYDAGTLICIQCHSACTACVGPTQYNCTGCISGYVLIGSYCRVLVVCLNYWYEGVCVNECPSGSYGILGTSTGNTCVACIYPCKTCLSAIACQSCIAPYTLSPSTQTCISSCPTSTYSENSTCKPCPPSCTQCTLNLNNQIICTSCSFGYIRLDGGQCVSSCGVGEVYIGGFCHRCGAYCATCLSLAYNGCVTCKSGYYFLLGSCYQTCPLSYTPSSSTLTCTPCPTSCSTCLHNTCLTCSQNYYLSITSPSICIPMNYYLNSLNQLSSCHPNCRSCTNSSFSSCIVCSNMRGDNGELAISGYCECREGGVDTGDGGCDREVYRDVVIAADVVVGGTQAVCFLGIIVGIVTTNFIPIALFLNYIQTYSNLYYLNTSTVLQTNKILKNYLNIHPITYYNQISEHEYDNNNNNISNNNNNNNNRLLLSTQTDQSLYLKGRQFQYVSQWGYIAFVCNVGIWGFAVVIMVVKWCCGRRGKGMVANDGGVEQHVQDNRIDKQQGNNKKQLGSTTPSHPIPTISNPTTPPTTLIQQLQSHINTLSQTYNQSIAIIFFWVTYSEITIYSSFSFKTLINVKLLQSNFILNQTQLIISILICSYYIGYMIRLIVGACFMEFKSIGKSSLRILSHMFRGHVKSKISKCFFMGLVLRTVLISVSIPLLAYNASYQSFACLSIVSFFFILNLCFCPLEGPSLRMYFHGMELLMVAQIGLITYISALPQRSRINASKGLIALNYLQVILCCLILCWIVIKTLIMKICKMKKKKKDRKHTNKIQNQQSLSNIVQKEQQYQIKYQKQKNKIMTELVDHNEIQQQLQNMTSYQSSKIDKIGGGGVGIGGVLKKESEHKISKKYRVKRYY